MNAFMTNVLALTPLQAALRGGLTLLVLIGAALIIWGVRLILKTLSERFISEADKKRGTHKEIGRWSMRIAWLAVLAASIALILRVWGLGLGLFTQGPIADAGLVVIRIAIILALAFAVIEFSELAVVGLFNRVSHRAGNTRRAVQLRTLAPVLAGVINTAVVIIAAMMALSQIGIEIGPLLAGAGIVGLAIGFGAQTIVKDFLTGIFLILEDALSVGDNVKIGDFSGTVEAMSLRTIKLRDYDGTLHVFPYSEAQVIHNANRGFAYAAFDIPLAFWSDVEKALDIIRSVADSVVKDPDFDSAVLAPAEIAGVDALSDNAIMLKGRIKTQSGAQWRVRREFYRRLKPAFDEAGLLFGQRQVPIPPFDEIKDRSTI